MSGDRLQEYYDARAREYEHVYERNDPARQTELAAIRAELRAALTGRMDGPCLVEICQLLGRERCRTRALAAMET